MALITRQAKGSKLTIEEMDGNLEYLESLANNEHNTYLTGSTLSGNTLILTRNDGYNIYQDFTNSNFNTIPLKNTVWVNSDLASNNETKRIFKTYDDAINWIQANGSPSATNLWQVNLPAGNVGTITLHPSIRVSATDGTYIEKLKSNKLFTAFADLVDAYISGALIGTIEIDNGQCLYLFNCIVKDVTPATTMAIYSANNTQFLGGDFENLVGYSYYSLYQDIEGDISNLTVEEGQHTDISHVDGSAYTLSCVNLDINFGKIKVTALSGTGNFNNCKVGDLTLNSTGKFNNCKVGDLTLNSEGSLFSINTYFESLICESVNANIRLCNLDSLTVRNGGYINVYNSVIGDTLVTGSSTLYSEATSIHTIEVQDTSTLSSRNSVINNKTFAAGSTIVNSGEFYNNVASGLSAEDMQSAIDELKALIDAM